MEYVRLRVFNDPRDERSGAYLDPAYQGPERTATVAKWVKDKGMGLGIDLHYADSWADPSKQAKPTAWAELPFDDLIAAVYDYTHDYMQQLIDQGTRPDKVAVGNELINGFLWGSERPQPWFSDPSVVVLPCYFNYDPAFVSQPGGALLWDYLGSSVIPRSRPRTTQRGIGSRRSRPPASRRFGTSPPRTAWTSRWRPTSSSTTGVSTRHWSSGISILTRLNAKGQDIDVMAHSYYPEWHGTPEYFEGNLHAIADAHPGYQLEIAETSHPSADYDGLPVPNSPYPKTPQGQADAIQRVFQIANDLPDNRGSVCSCGSRPTGRR